MRIRRSLMRTLKFCKPQLAQHAGGGVDQLDLGQVGGIPQDVDVALGELAEPPLLGPVGPPHVADLQSLERAGQQGHVVGIIAGEGQGQVVPQAAVAHLVGGVGLRQLFAPLEDLEDQLFVFAPLLAGEVFDMLHAGGLDLAEAVAGIGGLDQVQHIFPQPHVGGEIIVHALGGGLDAVHGTGSFLLLAKGRRAADSVFLTGTVYCTTAPPQKKSPAAQK